MRSIHPFLGMKQARFRPARWLPFRARRRGSLILELSVSMLLLGFVMTFAVGLLAVNQAHQRRAAHRLLALSEAGNVLERLTALPASDLEPSAIKVAASEKRITQELPGGTLKATASADPEFPSARRILVEIRWLGPGGAPEPPLRLTAWVVPREEVTP